ncbi:MAG: DUF393 domain-containing protein [Chlamydiae bacterium]|nr:DUF393 domain-containing protein [Chlamydiota bacterium]
MIISMLLPFLIYSMSLFLPLALLLMDISWLYVIGYALIALLLLFKPSFMIVHKKIFFFSFLAGALSLFFFYPINPCIAYPPLLPYSIFFLNFAFALVLILLHKKLFNIYLSFTNREHLEKAFTVIFDAKCSICSKEMCHLQKRKQSGLLIYKAPKDSCELCKITTLFSYSTAMKQIHGFDKEGNVLTGVDVLSEMYARTNLLFVAVLLQAPLLKPFFQLGYRIFSKFRLRIRRK